MKQKQVRQRQNAAKEAIEAYLDYMERHCHVKTGGIGACPECVNAYRHTLRYYQQTFKENR